MAMAQGVDLRVITIKNIDFWSCDTLGDVSEPLGPCVTKNAPPPCVKGNIRPVNYQEGFAGLGGDNPDPTFKRTGFSK